MKKTVKITAIVLAAILLFVIVFVLVIGLTASDGAGEPSKADYSMVMRRAGIRSDAKITDIAMLGAHDAFSNGITRSSKVDEPSEDSILNNGFVRSVGSGLTVRLTKAQKSGAEKLLASGVRYFDIRLSYIGGEWYTKHEKLSGLFSDYLAEVLAFLSRYDGEVVVLDFQHVYTGDAAMKDLFSYLDGFSVYGNTLRSFLHYDPFGDDLKDLTYGDVTNGGQSSGVVILAKEVAYSGCMHYEYEKSIRSVWHNKNTREALLAGIDGEYRALLAAPTLDRDKLRVNQAQLTGLFSFPEILTSAVSGWSLLKMAENFNAATVGAEDFTEWLKVMPVYMADFADSGKGDFNIKANDAIMAFNRAL